MDYRKLLVDIYYQVQPLANEGMVADYIPALAKVSPDYFGMCLSDVDGEVYAVKDADVRFSIQSISKVFALAMCLAVKGEALWKRVGKEPSGTAFNSLVQLEVEHGIPRNPFINAGALVLADVLLTSFENPEEEFLAFVRELCGSDTVGYNDEVALSERETGYLNAAIANMLKYHKNIDCDVERVLRFYFRMCSVEMSCRELSKAFLAFADHGGEFRHAGIELTRSQIKRMNAIMQTCGFYDEAKEGVGRINAVQDGRCVKIYPSALALGKALVGGDLQSGNGASEGGASTGGEEYHMHARREKIRASNDIVTRAV